MKIILAPDSFKESMSAKQACMAMEKGIRKVIKDVECIHVPMADGGEGTLDALVNSRSGQKYNISVTGPLGNSVSADVGLLDDGLTGVVEVAQASGLSLVSMDKRNPMNTTSFGTGEVIKSLLDRGVKKIIIGLGGSATNDAGMGMLQGLGAKFEDEFGQELGFGGGNLSKLKKIDLKNFDKRIQEVNFEVACDVKNYLTGRLGASYVFGAQKGATDDMLEQLDKNLSYFAYKAKDLLNKEIDKVEGAGAAGGLGAALIGFCNGKFFSGIDLIVKHSQLDEKIIGSDLILTGEGSIDYQTKYGKTIVGISKLAKKNNVPVIAFTGKVNENIDELYELGITSIIGISAGAMSLKESLEYGERDLERSCENIMRIWNSSRI